MSSKLPDNTFRITAWTDLKPGGAYDAWTCSECGAILTVSEAKGPQSIPIEPADGHVRIACPICKADRFYGINDRTVRQAPPA